MKRGLLALLVAIPLVFSSCNKEGEFVAGDLNGDGSPEIVLNRQTPWGYSYYYFNEGSNDTNYVMKNLSTAPFGVHYVDFDGDGYPNVYYERWSYEEGKRMKYFSENEGGVFGEEKKLTENN
ncbi:MAG: VCBS repeat-containing protein [Nanoarchaeota archaeon]|nr:VCBS repeat-containing protein [Nanoarchaeota archaeon]